MKKYLIPLLFILSISNPLYSQEVALSSAETYNGVQATGRYRVNFSQINGSGKLVDPVILFEGFDFFDEFGMSTLASNPLVDQLRTLNYDIVLVTFDSANVDIRRNEKLVKTLLNTVKSMLIEPGLPIAVIAQGPSGLMVHRVLKELETAGIAHQVTNVYTIDTPYHGFNVPPGLDFVMTRFESNPVMQTEAAKFKKFLRSPLSKDLLIFDGNALYTSKQLKSNGYGAFWYESILKDNTAKDGAASYLAGFKNGTNTQHSARKVAYTNGSTNVGNGDQGNILNFQIVLELSWERHNMVSEDWRIRPTIPNPYGNTSILVAGPTQGNAVMEYYLKNSSNVNYVSDDAPSAFSNLTQLFSQSIHGKGDAFNTSQGKFYVWTENFGNQNSTFVSTKSALNMAQGAVSWNVRDPFYPHSGSPGSVIPFSSYNTNTSNGAINTISNSISTSLSGDIQTNFGKRLLASKTVSTSLTESIGVKFIADLTINAGVTYTIPSGSKVVVLNKLDNKSSTATVSVSGIFETYKQNISGMLNISNGGTAKFSPGSTASAIVATVATGASLEVASNMSAGSISVANGGLGKVLQGSTLTGTGITVASGGLFEITGSMVKLSTSANIASSGKLTVKNTTFIKEGTSNFHWVRLDGSGATGSLFENVSISGSTHGLHIDNAGTVYLKNVNGSMNGNQAIKLNNTFAFVEGGTFTGNSYDGIAMYDGAGMQIKGSPQFTGNFIGIRAARGSYAYFGHGLNEPANMAFTNHTHSGVSAYTNAGIDLGIGVGNDFRAGFNTFNNAVRQVYVRQNSYVRSFATTLMGGGTLDGEAGSVIDLEYQDPYSPPGGGGPAKLVLESDPLVWLEEQPIRSAKAMQVYHELQRKPEQKSRATEVIKRKVENRNQADWTVPAMLELQREGRETEALALAERVTKKKIFSEDDQKSAWYLIFRTAVAQNGKNTARKALRELKKLKHEDAENGFCDLLLDGAAVDETPESDIKNPKSALVTTHPNPPKVLRPAGESEHGVHGNAGAAGAAHTGGV